MTTMRTTDQTYNPNLVSIETLDGRLFPRNINRKEDGSVSISQSTLLPLATKNSSKSTFIKRFGEAQQ